MLKHTMRSALACSLLLGATNSHAQGAPVAQQPAQAQPVQAQPAQAQPAQAQPAQAQPAQAQPAPGAQAYPAQQAYPQQQPQQGTYPPPQGYQQQPGGYPPGAYPPGVYPPGAYAPYPQKNQGPVPGSNREFLKMSTDDLEEELDDTGLGGPIVFLSIGVPVLVVGTIWFIASVSGVNRCENGSSGYDYYYSDNCKSAYTGSLLVSGTAVAAGTTFTILGSVLLPKRIAQRNALSKEIELRENYGRTSFFELRHGPLPTPGGGFSYGLSGTF